MASDDLRLQLTLPDHRISLGPITIDIIEKTLGVNLERALGRLLEGPPQSLGSKQRRYTLCIAAGDGVVIPMQPMGEVGLSHAGNGVLSVTHPTAYRDAFASLLASRDIKTSEPQVLETATGLVQQFFVRTVPGTSFGTKLAPLGELQLEVLPAVMATPA